MPIQSPRGIPHVTPRIAVAKCPFPECIACTLANSASLPLHDRPGYLSQRLSRLADPKCDAALVELSLHQLRTLVKSILLAPSSLAASLTSPAHRVPREDDEGMMFEPVAQAPPLAGGGQRREWSMAPPPSLGAVRDASDPRSPGAPLTPVGHVFPPVLAISTSTSSSSIVKVGTIGSATGGAATDGGGGPVQQQSLSARSQTATTPLSPSSIEKQYEVDLWLDAGLMPTLYRVLVNNLHVPVVTEMALNVLRDLLLVNVRDDVGTMLLGQGTAGTGNDRDEDRSDATLRAAEGKLPPAVPFLALVGSLLQSDCTTTVSSALDVVTSLFGTTSAVHAASATELAMLASTIVRVLTTKLAPAQVLTSLDTHRHQPSLLGISASHAARYAPRWSEILVDKALLALSTLAKSAAFHSRPLAALASAPGIYDVLSHYATRAAPMPAYPETDAHVNAAVALAILLPHVAGSRTLFGTAVHSVEEAAVITASVSSACRAALRQLCRDVSSEAELRNPLAMAFEQLDMYVPPPLLPSPARLLESFRRATALQQQQVCLLVHMASTAAALLSVSAAASPITPPGPIATSSSPSSSPSSSSPSSLSTTTPTKDEIEGIYDVFLDLLSLTSTTTSPTSPLAPTITRTLVTKSVRAGAATTWSLVALPALDTALLSLVSSSRLPRSPPRLELLAPRLDRARAAARDAYAAGALAEAEAWFMAAAGYATAIGRPACALLSSQAECLLGLHGRAADALAVAREAMEMCCVDHPHVEMTRRRIARAEKRVGGVHADTFSSVTGHAYPPA
ncbi:hypothetical protein BC828DRAFT_385266 [Blastocladiella britannica]|nr:hypothetical protein BC828DRAFT_385266 [Blastocladiella britannica]